MFFKLKLFLEKKNITLEISEKKLDHLMVKIQFLLFVSMWLDHRELWPLRRQAIKDVNMRTQSKPGEAFLQSTNDVN